MISSIKVLEIQIHKVFECGRQAIGLASPQGGRCPAGLNMDVAPDSDIGRAEAVTQATGGMMTVLFCTRCCPGNNLVVISPPRRFPQISSLVEVHLANIPEA
jgi:hypothetical protein